MTVFTATDTTILGIALESVTERDDYYQEMMDELHGRALQEFESAYGKVTRSEINRLFAVADGEPFAWRDETDLDLFRRGLGATGLVRVPN